MRIEEEDDEMPPEEQIDEIRLALMKDSVAYLDKKQHTYDDKHNIIQHIREQLVRNVELSEQAVATQLKKEELGSTRQLYKKIMLELLDLRRHGLEKISAENKYADEVLKDMTHNLDLEEARLKRH
jgi:CPA1 family monovalent cation:H+ antiporter